MLVTTRRSRRLAITALTGAALAFPAAALGANPNVVRIDAKTGKQSVLAGGGEWGDLTGLAVGPSGTIYVSNGTGISSLTAPKFAIKSFFASAPERGQYGLVASGSSLYALDARGLTRHDTAAPFAAQTVSDGGAFEDDDESYSPPMFGALSGSTLYATTFFSCDSVVGNGGSVVAFDVTSGEQSVVKSGLGCDEPRGIAAATDGSLLIALRTSDGAAQIVKVNPATGKRTTLSAGGMLKDPGGIALAASGDLIVADALSGVLRVSTRTGAQSKIASGPALNGASALALDARGTIYVAAAGPAPVVKASAGAQRLSAKAVAVHLSCRPRCAVLWSMQVTIPGDSGYSEDGSIEAVGSGKTLKVKLVKNVTDRIATALRHKQKPSVTMTLTPQIPGTDAPGKPISVTAPFTR